MKKGRILNFYNLRIKYLQRNAALAFVLCKLKQLRNNNLQRQYQLTDFFQDERGVYIAKVKQLGNIHKLIINVMNNKI